MTTTSSRADLVKDIGHRVAALATRQHGIVTKSQLLELAVSLSTLKRWLAAGRIFRIHPGVYAVGHTAPSRQGLMTAALLACGPDRSAIARRTALEVWGAWRVTGRPVDVVVVGRTRPRDGVDVHHSRLLPANHVRVRTELRVTSPARTLVDLALELDACQLANVIHELKYRRHYVREDFIRCIERMQASVGTPVALAALEMERIGSAGTKSELEQRMRALLLELGLQEPVSNVKVHTPIGWIELDNCWPDEMVYLEVDGPPHARMRSKNRDRDRRIGLKAEGWKEIRVGYLELDLDRAGVSRKLLASVPHRQVA